MPAPRRPFGRTGLESAKGIPRAGRSGAEATGRLAPGRSWIARVHRVDLTCRTAVSDRPRRPIDAAPRIVPFASADRLPAADQPRIVQDVSQACGWDRPSLRCARRTQKRAIASGLPTDHLDLFSPAPACLKTADRLTTAGLSQCLAPRNVVSGPGRSAPADSPEGPATSGQPRRRGSSRDPRVATRARVRRGGAGPAFRRATIGAPHRPAPLPVGRAGQPPARRPVTASTGTRAPPDRSSTVRPPSTCASTTRE